MSTKRLLVSVALVAVMSVVLGVIVGTSTLVHPVEAASGDTYEYATLFTIGGVPFIEMTDSAEQARLTRDLQAAVAQLAGTDVYYGWTPFLDVMGQNGFELKTMITDNSTVIFELARPR